MILLKRQLADMKSIDVALQSNAYPVYLGAGLLGNTSLWKKHLGQGKVLVVSNDTVAPLYLDTLRQGLDRQDCAVHIIPDGEQHKTVETWYGAFDDAYHTFVLLDSFKEQRSNRQVELNFGVAIRPRTPL